MPITNFSTFISALKSNDVLKILFYLYEFNPDVSIGILTDKLNLNETEIETHLDELEKFGVVTSLDESYRLTSDGREIVKGFYCNIGKIPPGSKTETPA